MGQLEAIWVKRAHRGPMDAVAEARLSPESGLEGSVDRSRRRQVTILSREAWEDANAEAHGNVEGEGVDARERRANLLVTGLVLAETRGRVLLVGEVRLLVGGETTPCERMEALVPGLQEAMRRDWRGGVFAQVLNEGAIRVGDEVRWEDSG